MGGRAVEPRPTVAAPGLGEGGTAWAPSKIWTAPSAE